MMVEFCEENGSEVFSVMFESSYEELEESFETEGYWDNLELNEETYSDSNPIIGLNFAGYHEDSTMGSLKVQVHGEYPSHYEEFDLNGVSRISVERILEGKKQEPGSSVDISPNGAEKAEAHRQKTKNS